MFGRKASQLNDTIAAISFQSESERPGTVKRLQTHVSALLTGTRCPLHVSSSVRVKTRVPALRLSDLSLLRRLSIQAPACLAGLLAGLAGFDRMSQPGSRPLGPEPWTQGFQGAPGIASAPLSLSWHWGPGSHRFLGPAVASRPNKRLLGIIMSSRLRPDQPSGWPRYEEPSARQHQLINRLILRVYKYDTIGGQSQFRR